MRFLSTRAAPGSSGVSFTSALFDGLAPDGGLYVPERIERWAGSELAALASRSFVELGVLALAPYVGNDVDESALSTIVQDALNFPIPLVEVEPGVYALELFHGPTMAFKDVGARVMARLMAALHEGGNPLTVLVATSGDTGSAVAHAFSGVPHTRVVILYPHGRVSPTQEAQLTMFNGEPAGNVRAYAVSGSFDDCQRLVKEAFSDTKVRRLTRLSSANSINVGRLLPQMIYYVHAVAQLARMRSGGPSREVQDVCPPVFSTPSGNFGNLTAGLMQKHAGLPIGYFVAATNANDIVPSYLETGRFEPRASVRTIANAMDVGHPSNFDRIMWLYGGDASAVRRDIVGSRHQDADVRTTIRRVYEERGYLLDPHSAIAYMGIKHVRSMPGVELAPKVFLATAHPAKFSEVVEPIIGRLIPKPAPLLEALSRRRPLMGIGASLDDVQALL